MEDMFYSCKNLTNIDLSSFDAKNVINMECMFEWCNNLKNVNISFLILKMLQI